MRRRWYAADSGNFGKKAWGGSDIADDALIVGNDEQKMQGEARILKGMATESRIGLPDGEEIIRV